MTSDNGAELPSVQELLDAGKRTAEHTTAEEEELPTAEEILDDASRPAGELREARDLLEEAITATGTSLRSFAENFMVRDERTVRRWRSGASPIPRVVTPVLRRIIREAAQQQKKKR
jgi:hypothetical protein